MKNKYLANEIIKEFKNRLKFESNMKVSFLYDCEDYFIFNIDLNNNEKMNFLVKEINNVGAYEVIIDYSVKHIYLDKNIFMSRIYEGDKKCK